MSGHDLFNQRVGTLLHERRDLKPERLGGLEIDDQLKTHRLLHRKFAGLCTAENFIDCVGRAPKLVNVDGRVRNEPAGVDVTPVWVHCR